MPKARAWRVYSALALGGTYVACAPGTQPPVAPRTADISRSAVLGETPSKIMREFDPALTPAQVAGQAKASVVVVTTATGLGTGVAVGSDQVLTALHVVAGAEDIVVRAADGDSFKATGALAFDERNDLALLHVAGARLPALKVADFKSVAAGQPVTVIGTPRGLEFTVSTGVVSAVRTLDKGRTLLQLTAAVSPGSSGGPVLDDRGRLVGIVAGYLDGGQQLNFAAAGEPLALLLSIARLPFPLKRFAELTAKQQSDAPATETSAPGMAPATEPPVLPPFPKSVAGFNFGSSLQQLQLACTTAAQVELQRQGLRWSTLLTVDGAFATCPDQVVALDFTKRRVALRLAAGGVVEIVLWLDTYAYGADRIREKYGDPSKIETGGVWKSWSNKVKGQPSLSWRLAGGGVFLFPSKGGQPATLIFRSDAADALRNEGF